MEGPSLSVESFYVDLKGEGLRILIFSPERFIKSNMIPVPARL